MGCWGVKPPVVFFDRGEEQDVVAGGIVVEVQVHGGAMARTVVTLVDGIVVAVMIAIKECGGSHDRNGAARGKLLWHSR